MTLLRFIRNNLLHYFGKNLLLAAGIAISGAVLTGALIVGDSVEYSLNRIVELRLGKVTHVVRAGDRYFTTELSDRMRETLKVPVSSLLLQEGVAVAGGGSMRLNQVNMLGVDEYFDQMAGLEGTFSHLSGDSIIISQNLARRLNLGRGDELLLRIEKASLIPLNAPFVSDAGGTVTLRATIKEVAGEEELGSFNLKVSQTAPFNVFMALSRMEELMDFQGRVNVMLLDAGEGSVTEQIGKSLREQFTAADAGLSTRYLDDTGQLEVTSTRVFIDDVLAEFLTSSRNPGMSDGSGPKPEKIITYFVNSISAQGSATPYSFVSALSREDLLPPEMVINRWLAEDLGAGEGDSVTLAYFVVGPLRELQEKKARFVIRSVVPMEGRYADRGLMPDLPGLSDAGNCRDWETGVPIDLDLIRDKDEDYWDRYGGIPKAFISLERAEELWSNRFGTYTAIRLEVPGDRADEVAATLLEGFDPARLGFTLEATRNKGVAAAGQGVDFTELFAGLSFFLLMAGILLTVLLFLLNLESRSSQLSTLVVLGIPLRTIRRIMLVEGMTVALIGAGAGLLLSIVYNRLVFLAMNGVWSDVIRTQMMFVDIRTGTLLTGFIYTLAIALVSIYIPLDRMLKRRFRAYRGPAARKKPSGLFRRIFGVGTGGIFHGILSGGPRRRRGFLWIFMISGVAALGMIASQLAGTEAVNPSIFFTAGGLLLVSALFFFLWTMERWQQGSERRLTLFLLSWKNALRNKTRSISILLLFAIGTFLVISTGSNRKDLFRNAMDPSSGTGGFLYYAESTVPVLKQLNDPRVRVEFGLEGEYGLVQMRRAEGDDASCLNLNRVLNPRVLGVDPGRFSGRFSFVTRTGYLDGEDPWSSLDKELPGGLIPAIADETAIKWGLGMEVGDTLRFTNSSGGDMELLLVGGIAPSIFQGNVLISDKHFLEQFPQSSGTHVFLVEGSQADTALIRSELERGMRDLGWEMELTAARLARFNSVTNTYLSIFMVMGALGLLVGIFGLVVVLSRSIMERKQEIALLKAVGYGKRTIRRMISREYMLLLLAGIATGFLAAVIATLPSLLSAHTGASFTSIALWMGILVVNGWIWIRLITRTALKEKILNEALRNE
jgi:putative ABC transport system permease protein